MRHFLKEKNSKISSFQKNVLRFLSLRYSADFGRSRLVHHCSSLAPDQTSPLPQRLLPLRLNCRPSSVRPSSATARVWKPFCLSSSSTSSDTRPSQARTPKGKNFCLRPPRPAFFHAFLKVSLALLFPQISPRNEKLGFWAANKNDRNLSKVKCLMIRGGTCMIGIQQDGHVSRWHTVKNSNSAKCVFQICKNSYLRNLLGISPC